MTSALSLPSKAAWSLPAAESLFFFPRLGRWERPSRFSFSRGLVAPSGRVAFLLDINYLNQAYTHQSYHQLLYFLKNPIPNPDNQYDSAKYIA